MPDTAIYGNQTTSLCGFEGPEKTIEIWFRPKTSPSSRPCSPHSEQSTIPSDDDCDTLGSRNSISSKQSCDSLKSHSSQQVPSWELRGLRAVKRSHWNAMLEIVQAQILSVVSNASSDAYLLSMFVYPHKIMLKTCGTTTLLNALPKILEIAKDIAGLDAIDCFFYSRKAFLFPDKQVFPHGNWSNEVDYLDTIFPEGSFDTSGYVIGKVNRSSDNWNLYVASPIPQETENPSTSENDNDESVTLEVMMRGLDPEKMRLFWKSHYTDQGIEADIFHVTGISEIYPTALIDDHVFSPCGYSLNGLVGKNYFTIHVTPESHCSYASFESTVPLEEKESFGAIISKVVDIFRPSTFSTSVFTRASLDAGGLLKGNGEYRLRDRITQYLGEWEVLFAHYTKY